MRPNPSLKRTPRGTWLCHIAGSRLARGAVAAGLWCALAPTAFAASQCGLGAYERSDGSERHVVVLASVEPGGERRYAFLDGRRGSLDTGTAPLRCVDGLLMESGSGTAKTAWKPITFEEVPFDIRSGDVVLKGLVMVRADVDKPSLVVLVHGSEKTSPLRRVSQLLLAAQGVAVFAYDKRGTGASTGEYTQDFHLLAEDAASALSEVRRKMGARFSRYGFYGGSQGGWVAPLAALRARADFVAVGFGVVGTAADQDIWQVDYQLNQAGFGSDISAAVHRVTAATAAVARCDFQCGMERVAALRARYSNTPWLAKIDGQYSGLLLRGEVARAQSESPGVPWRYSSLDAVRRLRIPQLWVFAEEDDVAPAAPSIARLQLHRSSAMSIKIAVFPATTHGMRVVQRDGAGQRHETADVVAGYTRLIADFAKGTVGQEYGWARWVH